MPLLALADIMALLVCPRCRGRLTGDDPTWRCANDSCGSGGPLVFDVLLGKWPVLVDFDTSILARDNVRPVRGGAPADNGLIRLVPARARRLVRPVNHVARANVARLVGALRSPHPLILIVGGGSIGNGIADLYADPSVRVLAFDIAATGHVQLVADAHQIPLPSASVDAVVVQAVLEHVLDPWQVVEELHRVLKHDGLVYAEVPFMQQVHAGPYDFTRFTESGLRWLFRRFVQIDRGVVAGPGTALSWSLDHVSRSIFKSKAVGQLVRLLFFWVRFADRIAGDRFASDSASAHFFLGRRSQDTIQPRDILAAYAGAQSDMSSDGAAGRTPIEE